MKIIAAPDSYKGCMTAPEAAAAMLRGALQAFPGARTAAVPMADGGEGTMQCLVESTGGAYRTATVQDPLGREREAAFGLLGDGRTCVVELAESSGLPLLAADERDPLRASSYGFGQLIRAGLDAGAREFLLCLGGSATNDGGAGMLQALGFELLDEDGRPIPPGGGGLAKLRRIETGRADPRLAACTWTVACDVDNPLVGPNGASAVFGPQKGADPDCVALLDANLSAFADVLEAAVGRPIRDLPGAGAAGGTAAALVALLGARLEPGIELCLQASGLARELADADLVLTGEGRVDSQTLRGKTPCGVARLAARHGVPTIVFGGSVGPGAEGLSAFGVIRIVSLADERVTVEEAIRRGAELLERKTAQTLREPEIASRFR
jgi:glycerate kinase